MENKWTLVEEWLDERTDTLAIFETKPLDVESICLGLAHTQGLARKMDHEAIAETLLKGKEWEKEDHCFRLEELPYIRPKKLTLNDYPKYVKSKASGHSVIIRTDDLDNGTMEYERPAGAWRARVHREDGKLWLRFRYGEDEPCKEVVPATEEEFLADNKGYV